MALTPKAHIAGNKTLNFSLRRFPQLGQSRTIRGSEAQLSSAGVSMSVHAWLSSFAAFSTRHFSNRYHLDTDPY